jgi:hypothetical protein
VSQNGITGAIASVRVLIDAVLDLKVVVQEFSPLAASFSEVGKLTNTLMSATVAINGVASA